MTNTTPDPTLILFRKTTNVSLAANRTTTLDPQVIHQQVRDLKRNKKRRKVARKRNAAKSDSLKISNLWLPTMTSAQTQTCPLRRVCLFRAELKRIVYQKDLCLLGRKFAQPSSISVVEAILQAALLRRRRIIGHPPNRSRNDLVKIVKPVHRPTRGTKVSTLVTRTDTEEEMQVQVANPHLQTTVFETTPHRPLQCQNRHYQDLSRTCRRLTAAEYRVHHDQVLQNATDLAARLQTTEMEDEIMPGVGVHWVDRGPPAAGTLAFSLTLFSLNFTLGYFEVSCIDLNEKFIPQILFLTGLLLLSKVTVFCLCHCDEPFI